jgi:hypothetical protein
MLFSQNNTKVPIMKFDNAVAYVIASLAVFPSIAVAIDSLRTTSHKLAPKDKPSKWDGLRGQARGFCLAF